MGNGAGEAGAERAPVLYGTDSGPEDDAVVHVYSYSEVTGVHHRCTGTLIAKNLVATAQHCVSNFTDGQFDCTPDGELDTASDAGEMGTLLDPAAIEIRVGSSPRVMDPVAAIGARIFAPQTTTICNNDVAFVILDRNIEGVPISAVRLESSVQPGDTLRVVGYGVNEVRVVDVRKARTGVRVDLVGENEFRPVGDAIAPRAFLTDGPVLCPGDSGGPAFAESGALVGVFSLIVGGTCESSRASNVFTQVSPFGDGRLAAAFEAAGATPILEPGEGSGGTGGSSSAAGGEAGEGGVPNVAGSGTVAGAPVGGDGGAVSGSSAHSGDSGAAGEASARQGLRQPGGCRCGVPGRHGDGAPLAASAAMAALGLLAWRRRGGVDLA